MSNTLKLVGAKFHFIKEYHVVGGFSLGTGQSCPSRGENTYGALQCNVGLQEEVPTPFHRHTPIHNCTVRRIAFDSAIHIGVFFLGGIETSVVSFSDDYDVDLGTIGFVLLIDLSASRQDLLVKFFFQDRLILAF